MLESIIGLKITIPILGIISITSVILGLIISLTHKYTSNASKSFLVTVAILPILVQTVIMIVNGNLGTSVAVMGAFSLIRFRSMPGNAKEILIVFFAMAIGLATGMGFIGISIIVTIIGCLLLIIFNNTKLFDKDRREKKLKILIAENLDYEEVFDDILNKYLVNVEMESVKTVNMGSMFELHYNIILKNDISEKKFIDELRVRNGNLKIALSHSIDDNEL